MNSSSCSRRNVLEAVQTSVYPKVIDCPPRNGSRQSLDAVAKNGIQLKVKARVTALATQSRWQTLQAAGMRRDFSWDRSAQEYVKIYERALAGAGG